MEKLKEEWKYIKGFNKYYKISNHGAVISNKRGEWRLMRPNYLKNGVVHYCLRDPLSIKRYLSAHRLVATHFIKNPCKYREVNHIDGNRKNNHISNLEWVNRRENTTHRSLLKKPNQLVGAYYDKKYDTYTAKIHVNGVRIYLGTHKTEAEANRAYINAHKKYELTNKYKTIL